jgi:hypothetical protein
VIDDRIIIDDRITKKEDTITEFPEGILVGSPTRHDVVLKKKILDNWDWIIIYSE